MFAPVASLIACLSQSGSVERENATRAHSALEVRFCECSECQTILRCVCFCSKHSVDKEDTSALLFPRAVYGLSPRLLRYTEGKRNYHERHRFCHGSTDGVKPVKSKLQVPGNSFSLRDRQTDPPQVL